MSRDAAADVLRELRARRRDRRLGRLEWFDIAYKAYLVVLFGGGAVLWVTGLVGDEPVVAGLDDVAARGPVVVSTIAAVAVFIGLRSGARGGPLAVEAADVAHLLMAPLPRRSVLAWPTVQRLRTAVLAGLSVGAVSGRLAAQRLPGSSWSWAAAGAAAGAIIGALWLGAALVGHRRPRLVTGAIGVGLVAWEAAALSTAVPSPLRGVGVLAFSPLPEQTATSMAGAWLALCMLLPVVMVAVGLGQLDRMSVEALSRRSALVVQLRFAATMQDLRTVVLLRRQLDEEHPRRTPWLALAAAGRSDRPSVTRVVWRRDVRGLLRLPLTRLARMALLAAAWGIALAWAIRGTTPALVVAGLAGFVLGLEAIEPLSQEVDHADRCDLLPIDRGELMVRHLAAPAAALVPFGLLGGAVAAVVVGERALVVPLLVLGIPAVWAAGAGSVVSAVRDAPDPAMAVRGSTSIAMPEITGLGTALRAAVPLAISCVGAAVSLFVRAAQRGGETVMGAALRGVAGALIVVVLTSQWVRLRDRARHSANQFLSEGRAASGFGRGGR